MKPRECPKCSGWGNIRVGQGYGDYCMIKCSYCKGTGIKPQKAKTTKSKSAGEKA